MQTIYLIFDTMLKAGRGIPPAPLRARLWLGGNQGGIQVILQGRALTEHP